MIPEFEDVYARNAWNGTETRSGPGSTAWATALVARDIASLADGLGARRVLDAACGEGLWMPDLPGYVGVDAVPAALEVARAAHPDRAYLLADVRTGLPVLPHADLVVSRDTMQHLPLGDGLACLETFRESGARWLLASTYVDGENVDVAIGGAYRPDLAAGPFMLGDPVYTFADGRMTGRAGVDAGKVLGFWELRRIGCCLP